MGMAGQLDSSRYRYFVAKEAGVSVENVEAMFEAAYEFGQLG